jgi:hypothetical protein
MSRWHAHGDHRNDFTMGHARYFTQHEGHHHRHVLLLFWTHYSFFVFIKALICARLLLCSRARFAIRRSYTPYHWLKATNFPKSATHAIDFGPGGLNGIGPSTARNFEGRGVHVIVLGEKGRGSYELYDSKTVKFEDWWTRKWTPKLVKTRYVAFW